MGVKLATLLVSLLAAAPQPGPAVSAKLEQLAPDIRVVLSDEASQVAVGGELLWSRDEETIGSSSEAVTVSLAGDGVQVVLPDGGKRQAERLCARPARDGANCVLKSRSYRGRFEFFKGKSGGLVVLNVVPLEDYLLSVVPSEMPANWPQEALRAQAVAARTFAVSRMIDHIYDTYDVYNDQSAQVYSGIKGESARSSQAVRDTAGQILTYQGAPIVAYFCSDVGGFTRTGKQPYLQGVPSYCPESPHNNWRIPLSPEKLAKLAAQSGHDIGAVSAASTEGDDRTGYLHKLHLSGSKGECTIDANKLRELLGLNTMKSTRVHLLAPGATSPAAPPVPAATVQPSAGQGSGVRVAVPNAAPQFTLDDWARPFVAGAQAVAALKLRNLYAYDGERLVRCDTTMSVWQPEGAPTPAAALDTKYTRQQAPPVLTPAPQPAPAASVSATLSVGADGLVLEGSGYGHGLGMPQYGAKQLALDGRNYREILLYFYTGVELVNWDGSIAKAPTQDAPAKPEDNSGFYHPFSWRQ